MIPHTDDALRMLSQRLMTQLLPDLKTIYSLSDGSLAGFQLVFSPKMATKDYNPRQINKTIHLEKENRQNQNCQNLN